MEKVISKAKINCVIFLGIQAVVTVNLLIIIIGEIEKLEGNEYKKGSHIWNYGNAE